MSVDFVGPDLPNRWDGWLGGVYFGCSTPYGYTGKSGFDELPPLRSTSDSRPNSHGVFEARDWAEGRTLDLTFNVWRDPEALDALRRVLVPTVNTVPFWMNVPGKGPLRWDVKVRRYRNATNFEYEQGMARLEVQLYAPDPLGYGPEQVAEVAFPELVGGLEFDLFTDGLTDTGFLEFGERGETGRARLTNEGNAESYPLFHVAGPALDGFELVAVGPGRRIRWEGRLYAGDLLTVDPARGTALLNGTADRSGLFTRREWFAVPPGEELEVQFLPVGTSVGATATIVSASAWW